MVAVVGADIEAPGLKANAGPIWSITIGGGKKIKCYHDCNGMKVIPAEAKKILCDPKIMKVFHRSEYDVPYLERWFGFYIPNIWDSALMEIIIIGMRFSLKKKNLSPAEIKLMEQYNIALKYTLKRYGLPVPDKELREEFIGRQPGIPFSKPVVKYMHMDVAPLPALQKAQEYILRREELLEVGLLENLVARKVATMRVRGIGFDSKLWREIALANTSEYNKRMAALPKVVKNWASEKQVKAYFMSKGILIDSYENLPKILFNTRNKVLAQFIYARELHKSVTSYGLNWFDEGFVDDDGRIRCNIDQIINSGRMSMSNPNLQQLTGPELKNPRKIRMYKLLEQILKVKRIEQQHRRAFIPAKGHVFVIGDFSGQEMGIMAAASNEKLWIDAMLRGEDIHGLIASMLYPAEWQRGREKGCTFPMKCKCKGHLQYREPTKILNFMLAYGGGPQKFAEDTGTDELTARAIVARYKKIIPNLTRWLEKNGRNALDTGVSYSADPYRRRRVLKGEEAWQIVNQGKNNPIQSAGANMLKLAMVSVPDKYYIALVIHDEIILEVPKAQAKAAQACLKKVMADSADYITGIKGLVRVEPRIASSLMKE